MTDEYLRDRLEYFAQDKVVIPHFLGKRFPVGTVVKLPRANGGGIGKVDSFRSNYPDEVVVREERGGSEPHTHFVLGLDLLKANPTPAGGM